MSQIGLHVIRIYANVPGNESCRAISLRGAKVPGSEKARERKGPGAKRPGNEKAVNHNVDTAND